MGLCAISTALVMGLHLLSYHTDVDGKYNNVNPGIYVGYNSYVLGTYYNSNRKQTVYIGREFELDDNCRYDITIGVATGYRPVLMPAIIPGVKFDSSIFIPDSIIRLQFSPTIRSTDDNNRQYGIVGHISIEMQF